MTRTQRKRDEKLLTVLRVPNTQRGQKFLADLRSYATGGTRVWARGRGPRRIHGLNRDSCPQSFAEWLGVYISKTRFETIESDRVREWREFYYRNLTTIEGLENERARMHERLRQSFDLGFEHAKNVTRDQLLRENHKHQTATPILTGWRKLVERICEQILAKVRG